MSLNNLMRYRFTKKAGEKKDDSGSQDGGDSQSTVQNGSQPQTQDSQATVDPHVIPESPHSPLSQNGFGFLDDEDLPEGTPELDSDSPLKPNGKFRRIMRPIDSDDSQDVSITASTEGSSDVLPRLKTMFPNASDNRIRAAMILHANNFNKAVEFMTSDPSRKRSLDQNGSTTPEKTFKRIKMAPQSPSSPAQPIVVNTDFLNEPPHTQKSLEFLHGCFPALTTQELKTSLEGNNGDAALTCAQLTSAHGAPLNGAGPHNNNVAGPSKPKGNISTLSHTKKTKKAKKKNIDMSDESEDDYDDFSGDSDDSDDLDNRSKSETDTFLEFFEQATIEELTAMPGCSKKKAELIMGLRPFNTWETLYEKISAQKALTIGIISGCKEVMQVRNTVRRLMVRCENISHEMGLVVSRLTQAQGAIKAPAMLTKELTLKPYQLIGISWLKVMHEQELNGILADEMGLGKTIQAIAFLAQLKEHGEEGPHVIIVPSSTIENWLREIQKWCPGLKVIVYYGSQDERRAVRHSIFFQGEEFNILLTTYNMATGAAEDRVLFKKFEFHYAVFDEGHMLKNMSSLRFQNLMKISAERRLLLTGTPLQNNLLELMSLLCFVMPEIFQGKTDHLKKVFTMISKHDEKKKSRFERDRIAHAKRIMKPFVLRRLKKDVLSQLPPKTERLERCSMLPAQQEVYDSLLTRYACEVTDKDGEEEQKANKSVGIFMQFRKAANHPLLLRKHYTDDMLKKMAKNISREPSHRDRGALPKLIEEDMGVMNDFELLSMCKHWKKYLGDFILDPSVISESGKFRVLDRLLPEMKEKDDRVLLFSQFTMMLDVVEVYMQAKGYKYLRLDGQTPVPDRLQLIDKFNNNPDIFIFLLSTRAGGLGINLTAANTIILHDIDFNPYNDKQAEDRCHRLGQKKEVHVVRLICEGTVDEVMLRCANSKLALERDLAECDAPREGEEETKDVANMLKEVFRTANQRKANTQNTSLTS